MWDLVKSVPHVPPRVVPRRSRPSHVEHGHIPFFKEHPGKKNIQVLRPLFLKSRQLSTHVSATSGQGALGNAGARRGCQPTFRLDTRSKVLKAKSSEQNI